MEGYLIANRLSGAIVLSISYGYDAAIENDPFLTKIMRLVDLIVTVLTPERAALLGAIPFREFRILSIKYKDNLVDYSGTHSFLVPRRTIQATCRRVPHARQAGA